MRAPFVLSESGTLLFFASATTLESYVEVPDVENKEYVAYDRDGQMLRMVIQPFSSTIGLWTAKSPILLAPCDPPRFESEQLRELLVRFVARIGAQTDVKRDETIDSLLLDALVISGFTQ